MRKEEDLAFLTHAPSSRAVASGDRSASFFVTNLSSTIGRDNLVKFLYQFYISHFSFYTFWMYPKHHTDAIVLAAREFVTIAIVNDPLPPPVKQVEPVTAREVKK